MTLCLCAVCLSVCHKSVFYRNGWTDWSGFWRGGGLLPFRRGPVFWTTMQDGLGQQVHVHHVSGRITYGGSGRAGSREDWPVRGQLWIGWWRIQSRPKKSLKSLKKIFKNSECLAKLQARTWLFRAPFPSFSIVLAKRTSARDSRVLACNFGRYSPILKFLHSQTQQ